MDENIVSQPSESSFNSESALNTQSLQNVSPASSSPSAMMTNEWMTIEQAAIALKCSTRTIARRIKNSELETRSDDAGRRLVLICRPESKPPVTRAVEGQEITSPATEINSTNAISGELIAQALQVVITQTRDDAERARDQASLAIAAAGQARRETRWAWTSVAAMLIVLGVAGGVATHRMTQQRAQNYDLQRDVSVANASADDANRRAAELAEQLSASRAETEKARQETSTARIDEARAQGETHGMAEAVSNQPENGNVLDRMMAAIDK